ncbi:hypothetical protein KUCAC02_011231 [Chaenocephalus aceratus]|uniref:Uncharacterized protein n=1 Tax=Chaenocephalus aceratus TaxID=36190 RepID=A0ACB9WVU8_CHAAC|nr:hypothetical protein KUCAC02_011231 [Chaenocephalus aceratus]
MASTSASEKPSVSNVEENRSRLCSEFAGITGADSAVAQCYLVENQWEMQKAMNSFFEADLEKVFEEDMSDSESSSKRKRQKIEEKPPAESIDLTGESPVSTRKPSEEDDHKLSLISWNVDGLDTDNIGERARGLCSYLVLYTPDGGEEGYFTGIMLKKSRVKFVESEIVTFPTTQMMRNLLVAQVTFKGQKLCLMTSHLESCKAQAGERMKQLRVAMQRMREAPDDVTVLFGGDTNLRDTEVAKVGLPPTGHRCVGATGKQEHMPNQGGVPRLAPDHMALLGLEKLDCGRFTSDHWGIYCSFIAA